MENCCVPTKNKNGIIKGLLYGIMPHTFCITFIIFSVLGATIASAFFKKILLIPYFFEFLIGLSIVFATISAIIYLKKIDCLCKDGIKRKWKYLVSMYTITIVTNLLVFFVIFPAVATMKSDNIVADDNLSMFSISVQLPCAGHAPLIMDELKTINGINAVEYRANNNFDVQYNPKEITQEQILSLPIFNNFKATIL